MEVTAPAAKVDAQRSWPRRPRAACEGHGPHGRWWRAEVVAQQGVVVFADSSLLSPLHGESPLSVILRCVFFSPLLYAVESLATCDELNKLGAELILADLEA